MGRLFLKRLKGLSIRVGFDNPKISADEIFNPILRYISEQCEALCPRGGTLTQTSRELEEQSEPDWLEIDFLPIFVQKFTEFNSLVDGIEKGTIPMSEEVANRLYDMGEECSLVLFKQYICYCFAYENYSVSLGKKPMLWKFLFEDSASTRNAASRGYMGYVGGVPVENPSPEWEDDPEHNPYEFEPDWTDYLLPWNWGKTKPRLKREKMTDKWANYQEWLSEVYAHELKQKEIRRIFSGIDNQ